MQRINDLTPHRGRAMVAGRVRWDVRISRAVVYLGAAVAAGAILVMAVRNHPRGAILTDAAVEGRQLLGLWALALLLAGVIVGPLASVVPWLPLKSHLVYARRAVGIAAFAFALAHVLCYLPSPWRRGWRELYTPGALWVSGLALGVLSLADMAVLALTSTDAAVKRLGGRRWKRLHRSVYLLVTAVWVHALCLGADFGINRAPDVSATPDAGALIGFAAVTLCWLMLVAMRWRGVRWRGWGRTHTAGG